MQIQKIQNVTKATTYLLTKDDILRLLADRLKLPTSAIINLDGKVTPVMDDDEVMQFNITLITETQDVSYEEL